MSNNIIQISQNWYSLDGFKYKLMKYQKSCFPCSLHIAYANLGKIDASGSEIEDEWNILSNGSLIQAGLTPEQIHDCMGKTKYNLSDYSLFTPKHFESTADMDRIITIIAEKFISDPSSSGKPAAMITATAHAEVLFRTDDNRVFYCCPSPDAAGRDYCYEIEITGINASTDGSGLNQAAIFYRIKNGKEQYAIMADNIMLIN